jgi:hypothetical protein
MSIRIRINACGNSDQDLALTQMYCRSGSEPMRLHKTNLDNCCYRVQHFIPLLTIVTLFLLMKSICEKYCTLSEKYS